MESCEVKIYMYRIYIYKCIISLLDIRHFTDAHIIKVIVCTKAKRT